MVCFIRLWRLRKRLNFFLFISILFWPLLFLFSLYCSVLDEKFPAFVLPKKIRNYRENDKGKKLRGIPLIYCQGLMIV